MQNKYIFSLFLIFISFSVFASGIKGTIKTSDGDPLPFATIFVKETGSGTVTNAEGYYEIDLDVGNYAISFQYLGYQTEIRQVNISHSAKEVMDIVLVSQTLKLDVVEISDGREDPAYTVMRKAIAKANYHRQQIESYSAQVYIKGSGRLLKSPLLLRKKIEKEGIDSTTAFLIESVSEISYQRPNTFKEKVISIREQGDNNSVSPNGYINSSFYKAQVMESVSPLSPKAMAYYRFEFLGSYIENGIEINKIKVTPRSRGEGVFEGTINIVEDWWSIHSLDFKTHKLGFVLNLQQVYGLIQEKAWLPVTHKFIIDIKAFGFIFKYNYLATASNYKIELNPDLDVDFKVIDEKIEKEVATEMAKNKSDEKSDIKERLGSGEELKMKDLRKLMKKYEKEERKEKSDPKVEQIKYLEVDSNAYNRDTSFWANIRPVPLTSYEIKSYEVVDSLTIVKVAEKDEGKETKVAKKKAIFKVVDIALGGNYKLGKRTRLIYEAPWTHTNFNTVEGYHFGTDLKVRHRLKNLNVLRVGVVPRYSLARKNLIGKSYLSLRFGEKYRKGNILVEGGRFVSQLNEKNPIHPYINAFYTLLFQENYMKLLEKDFMNVEANKRFSDKFHMKIGTEYAVRKRLENDEDAQPWFGNKEDFTPNFPINTETNEQEFLNHTVFNFEIGLVWKPWLRYNLSNGSKEFFNRAPYFFFNYKKGLVDADYHSIELGAKYVWDRWDGSHFNLKFLIGETPDKNEIFFPDTKHFAGNRTIFVTSDPVESFRLLDYYAFSTRTRFAEIHAHYQFRKLLASQIPVVWMMGLKENLFASYLATSQTDAYMEVGYGLDNILKIFRIEAVASFQDFKYQDFGIRIGISTTIGVGISNDDDDDSTTLTIGL